MKKLLVFLLSVSFASAQHQDVVSWINTHAIAIEDANPDTAPVAFAQHAPQRFKNARIFGFGEASHHGKEFFDLKAKFFKYLVEHQSVRRIDFRRYDFTGYVLSPSQTLLH